MTAPTCVVVNSEDEGLVGFHGAMSEKDDEGRGGGGCSTNLEDGRIHDLVADRAFQDVKVDDYGDRLLTAIGAPISTPRGMLRAPTVSRGRCICLSLLPGVAVFLSTVGQRARRGGEAAALPLLPFLRREFDHHPPPTSEPPPSSRGEAEETSTPRSGGRGCPDRAEHALHRHLKPAPLRSELQAHPGRAGSPAHLRQQSKTHTQGPHSD